MPSPAAELIARRVGPSTVVALSRVTGPARLAAAAQRRTGRSGEVELYFAFDDPCSAVAVIDLAARMSGRPVDLLMKPVMQARDTRATRRSSSSAATPRRREAPRQAPGPGARAPEPLRAGSTAFLAEWVAESAQRSRELTAFCARAMRHLWFETEGEPSREALRAIWIAGARDAHRQRGATRSV